MGFDGDGQQQERSACLGEEGTLGGVQGEEEEDVGARRPDFTHAAPLAPKSHCDPRKRPAGFLCVPGRLPA